MDDLIRDNQQALAILTGLMLFGLGMALPASMGLAGILVVLAVIFLLLGLFGDRITEVTTSLLGFKMVRRRFTEGAKRAIHKVEVRGSIRPTGELTTRSIPGRGTQAGGTGGIKAPAATVAGSGSVHPPTLGQPGKVIEPTIVQGSFGVDAVIAAASAMEQAATPEELAERVVEYVRAADATDHRAVVAYLANLSADERANVIAAAEADQPATGGG